MLHEFSYPVSRTHSRIDGLLPEYVPISHAPHISTEFLSLAGVFEDELNPQNPLGMHGAIAEAFGALSHRIWDTVSHGSSYSPRDFKQVLQKFAP